MTFFAIVRPCLSLSVAYATDGWSSPSLTWYLLTELFLYPIVVDFWFYLYHRACHEIGLLWKFHRTHHLAKHPIPILASYSDLEQELIEVAIVPTISFFTLRVVFGLPLNFYEWWVCQAYILFEEVLGHSGLRIYAEAPGVVSPILRLINCELVIEDHDLHHRRGWKKAYNYGKQTRLWDRLFGTPAPRLESENVDWNTQVDLPLF